MQWPKIVPYLLQKSPVQPFEVIVEETEYAERTVAIFDKGLEERGKAITKTIEVACHPNPTMLKMTKYVTVTIRNPDSWFARDRTEKVAWEMYNLELPFRNLAEQMPGNPTPLPITILLAGPSGVRTDSRCYMVDTPLRS